LASQKKLAPLIFLPDECGLERLTVEGTRDVICALIGGTGRPSQDVALRDVELLNRGGIWKPEGEYRMAANCCVVAGPIHGLKLLNSRLEGARCFFRATGFNPTCDYFWKSFPVLSARTIRCVLPSRSNRMPDRKQFFYRIKTRHCCPATASFRNGDT